MKKKKNLTYRNFLLQLLGKIENGSISVIMQDGVILNIVAKES